MPGPRRSLRSKSSPGAFSRGVSRSTRTPPQRQPKKDPSVPVEIYAIYDCWKYRVATVNGVVTTVYERDITYQAINGNGDAIGVATITEQLTPIKGTPGPASSGVGTFFDAVAVGRQGPFEVAQTFTVTVGNVTYSGLPLYDRNGSLVPYSTNDLDVYPGDVFVNNNDKPKDGKCK